MSQKRQSFSHKMELNFLDERYDCEQDLLFPLTVETTKTGFIAEHKNSIKTQENETLLQCIESMVGEKYQND